MTQITVARLDRDVHVLGILFLGGSGRKNEMFFDEYGGFFFY